MKKVGFFLWIMAIVMQVAITAKAEITEAGQLKQRMEFYERYEWLTGIPWSLIAAIDQYERNTKNFRDYCVKEDEVISICIDPKQWSGLLNPFPFDDQPHRISLFGGIGRDGDGDGRADWHNPHDRLMTMMTGILTYGLGEEEIKQRLTDYYQTEKGVEIIFTIKRLFEHFQTIDLGKRVFPIPRYYRADYTNNFGTGRSWGGRRIHEGIDIFAFYGTPVLSTTYGVIEIMGWNDYGGYRIGIRDMYNTYEYYAHLLGYAKGLKVGDIVEPGQIIGYVGSTGYGKEGTSGKFPPHLHFGLYKFDGKREWSFNPYPYLRRWERVKGFEKHKK